MKQSTKILLILVPTLLVGCHPTTSINQSAPSDTIEVFMPYKDYTPKLVINTPSYHCVGYPPLGEYAFTGHITTVTLPNNNEPVTSISKAVTERPGDNNENRYWAALSNGVIIKWKSPYPIRAELRQRVNLTCK